jgi:hypothetical protein
MGVVETRKALIGAAKDFLTANDSIQTAEGLVTGLPTLSADDIGWENRLFQPEGKNPWASVFYRPNIPAGRTVGQRGYDQITGFVQIDFNIAPSKGTKILTDWEDKARIFFHPGRFFTYSGQGVLITSCGMSTGRHTENFYRKSLTVAFRSHIKRQEVT